jgi:hypothetical protein
MKGIFNAILFYLELIYVSLFITYLHSSDVYTIFESGLPFGIGRG